MADGTTLHDKKVAMGRADRLAPLLEDRDFWDRMEAVFIAEWKKHGPEEKRGVAAWYKLQALERVQQELRAVIGEGEHARQVLKNEGLIG